MNKIAFFVLGALTGIAGTLYVVSDADINQELVTDSNIIENTNTHPFNSQDQTISYTQPEINKPLIKIDNAADMESLLNRFTANTANLFESQEYKDLAYLIRKDKKLAAQVRKKFVETNSYEEKYALMNLLSQDSSEENINLVIEMIKNQDDESKRLGFELLRSMDITESHSELNQALLDATYYESNPEVLTDVIFRLTEKKLDDTTKFLAIERFNTFLSSSNPDLKARAIDGLSQLGDQQTITMTVKRYLQDSNESVRIAAISAAFKLNSGTLDSELLGNLTRISQNPEEPENLRNIATAVLDSQKSAL
jgi:hypothetical protein